MVVGEDKRGQPVARIAGDGIYETLEVRRDGRIWRRTKGDIEALVPITTKRASALMGDVTIKARLVTWRKSAVPPPAVLRWVWQKVLSRFNEEVGAICGADEAGGAGIMVPQQEVTFGSVNFEDKAAAAELSGAGYYYGLGSIHKHPGAGGSPSLSGIDYKSWEKSPGFHCIVNGDGTWATRYAVTEGVVFKLDSVKLPDKGQRPKWFKTSGGRALGEVITKPAPIVIAQEWDNTVEVGRAGPLWKGDDGWRWDNEKNLYVKRMDKPLTMPPTSQVGKWGVIRAEWLKYGEGAWLVGRAMAIPLGKTGKLVAPDGRVMVVDRTMLEKDTAALNGLKKHGFRLESLL